MNPKQFFTFLLYWVVRLREKRSRPGLDLRGAPYPLVVSYSDFMIVPVEAMPAFTRLCRLFAALDTFVEMAAPTALGMTCAHVTQETDSRWRLMDVGGQSDHLAFCHKYDYDVSRLLRDFPSDTLFIHPIKFSQWRL